MNFLEKLEHGLGGWFRRAAGGVPLREPVEIRRAIIRAITDQVQSKGGGHYFFPFREVGVEILARDATEQQLFEASFDPADFTAEVRSQIADRGCTGVDVVVRIAVKEETTDPPTLPYRIRYQRQAAALQTVFPRPCARLIVVHGNTDAPDLPLDRDLFYIGRMKEVMNTLGGLERRNQLAFDATETTVHRKHACIKYDPSEGKFRAFNDPESSLGTSVFREGRVIVCDSTRGVQLRSGDEILLGEGRVRFEIIPGPLCMGSESR